MWVIRYPRGGAFGEEVMEAPLTAVRRGEGRVLGEPEGARMAVLSVGAIGSEAAAAVAQLAEEGIPVAHYDLRFVKPLDEALLERIAGRGCHTLIIVEDGVRAAGAGSAVLEYLADKEYTSKGLRVVRLGLPDHFVEQGTVQQLRALCGIDAEGIARRVREALQE